MIHPAQRLWVLERDDGAPSAGDVCRFVGAVAILGERLVYVVLARSAEVTRAGEAALDALAPRLNVERDAFKFVTLDDAMAWAEATKRRWMVQGWAEVGGDIW
jgi:hypothetical protein